LNQRYEQLVSAMQRIINGARCMAAWARLSSMSSRRWRENARLKRIVADLELDKLILKESLDYFKPKA